MAHDHQHDEHDEHRPVGAEGGEDSARTGAPFAPHPDDDSALGDTDQHSRTAREGTDPADDQGMRG